MNRKENVEIMKIKKKAENIVEEEDEEDEEEDEEEKEEKMMMAMANMKKINPTTSKSVTINFGDPKTARISDNYQ